MESKQVLSIINEVENSIPVQTWNIEGMDIWPYVRFKLRSSLFVSESRIVKNKYYNLLYRYVLGMFRYLLTVFRQVFRSKHSDRCDYLFVENGVHVAKHKDSFYYVRTDPVREKLEKKGMKCFTYVTGYKFNSPSFFSNEHIQYAMDIKYFLTKLLKKKRNLNIDGYELFEKFLKKKDIYDKSLSKENICKGVRDVLFYRDFFKKRLLKLKPKAVFVLCYYSTYGYGLIKACKELNIPLVDIQHGIQGDHHTSYSSFKKVPKNGYNTLPDIFYVWDEEDRKEISSWKNDAIKIFKGGNDYFNMWKQSGNELVKSTKEGIQERYSLSKYSKVILFTVYPGGGHDDLIVKAIQNSPKEWFWFVRHHPKSNTRSENMKERIGEVKCGIAIDDLVSIPIFALIALSDIHITDSSSTVIECAEMGVSSIVTTKEGRDFYKTQYEQKMLLFTTSVEEILKNIKESKRKSVGEDNESEGTEKLIEIIDHIYAHHN